MPSISAGLEPKTSSEMKPTPRIGTKRGDQFEIIAPEFNGVNDRILEDW